MDSTRLPVSRRPPEASLTHSIHAASIDPDAWSDVLERMRRHLDARILTIGYHDFASGLETALFESPQEFHFCQEMASFSARNPWFLSSEDYVAGRVVSGEDVINPTDLRRTDFYKNFLQPHGLLHRLCGVVSRGEAGMHFLCAFRSDQQQAFGENERLELEGLLAHVALSLESQWRWQEAADMSRAILTLSDGEGHAVMLVTAEGRLLQCNQAGSRLLESRAGLHADGEMLRASNPGDQRLLRESIARACEPANQAFDSAAPQVLTLAEAPPGLPLVVILRHAGPVFLRDSGSRRPLVLLSVRSGIGEHDAPSCAFAKHYELTLAQARVSSLIYSGRSLSAIAGALYVSENTVRSHLKQIFQKTGAHSQMDLVHLHARICPGWI